MFDNWFLLVAPSGLGDARQFRKEFIKAVNDLEMRPHEPSRKNNQSCP
jgi:hypothetical protein